MTVIHWDDVERHRRAKGEMAAEWQRLGSAAGTEGVGVNRVRIEPGMLSTPPHSHGASEEIFFVLGGSGLSWQDEHVYEVGPSDCILHLADHEEHTLRAGEDGLDYLVFGTNHPTEIGWLPRSRAIRVGWPWVEGRTDDPWDIEAKAEPLKFGDPQPRPPTILNAAQAEREEEDGLWWCALAPAAQQSGLNLLHLPAGRIGAPPHCHSEEEEVFVVLKGEGTLELWPTPVAAERGIAREDIPLRAGSVIARPPATKVAHAFRGGPAGLTMLLYGTRRPNDIAYYPRSNEIYWRGVGLRARLEHVEYMDGEPDPRG